MGFAAHLPDLLARYGYLAIATIIMLESMGVPLPGETTLVTASVYAGTSHNLNIWLVVLSAVAGAVIGDNIGYWVGEKLGYRLLLHYGPRIGITDRQIKLGQYLFIRHGAKVVFFGRFVAVLRVLAAFLAGVNCMHWSKFFIANLTGAILWAALFGFGAFALGHSIHRLTGPVGIAALGIGLAVIAAALAFAKRHEERLTAEAERALPGPLREP